MYVHIHILVNWFLPLLSSIFSLHFDIIRASIHFWRFLHSIPHSILTECVGTDFCNTILYLPQTAKALYKLLISVFLSHIFSSQFLFTALCVAKLTFVPKFAKFAPTSFNRISWHWLSLSYTSSRHISLTALHCRCRVPLKHIIFCTPPPHSVGNTNSYLLFLALPTSW